MSRFVSGGTDEEPTERDEEWRKAQQEIETRRREKAEASRQETGKSLFETLQANKAAKQEQFEESIRLKNQFRSLDEDEVEFLDSVLASTRAKEAAVAKETKAQLDAFRKQREEAEQAAKEADAGPDISESAPAIWSVGPRKRKKARDDVLSGVKLRRTSSTGDKSSELPSKTTPGGSPSRSTPTATVPAPPVEPSIDVAKTSTTASPSSEQAKPTIALGLASYSSDEDD